MKKTTLKEVRQFLNNRGIARRTQKFKGLLEELLIDFAQQVNKISSNRSIIKSGCIFEGCYKPSTCGDYYGTHSNCRKK